MIKGERRTAANWTGMAILAIVAALQGCSWERSREPFWDDVAHYRELLQQTSYEDAACPSPLTSTTSGPPIMIDAVIATLKDKGLPEERVYFDKF